VKVVMTLLVRDEEDILAANFECHLSQGVDFFIVTDNLSVDGSRDIIEHYVRAGVAVCLDETCDDYSQALWVTRMARMAAAEYGADWVINSDADEFWFGSTEEGIKVDLAAVGDQASCVSVSRSNYPPVDEKGVGFFAERMRIREHRSYNAFGEPLQPKICHRGFTEIEVNQGNHSARRGKVPLQSVRAALRILHYPARSYRQLENKIVKGGSAYARNTELPAEVGGTWRYLYSRWQAGELRAFYQQMILSTDAMEHGLLSGELLYDDTLLTVLRPSMGDSEVIRGNV
jgi:hypothetical protein